MDKQKIIEMLNQDIEGEHAAIIQYLSHAYAMGEGEMSCEIEALAREEMRHLDWLAETVAELGGTPSLERGVMRTGGKAVSDWMSNDILQEDDAIKLYKEHIKAIDDPKLKRLLKRILSDEESHRGDFVHFVDKAKKERSTDLRGDKKDEVTEVLNWGIEHEYTVILQYLLQSYLSPNAETNKDLQDQAINEMQHLGWLAEEIIGGGSHPVIEHTKVDRSRKTVDMLRADIKIEKEVAEAYDRAAKKIKDPGLKKLLIRIRDHEIYHTDVFTDLLKEEEK
ncbi:MAG: ferritin-like domain-containing protein [Deltaproteobacteria bacterium]|nr:ferritin-like domain-containing protein [Deltaproteobacteria bacterium]